MKTLELPEAAALLKINPSTLRSRAAAGIIPGAKVGRAWCFIEADLIEYLRGQYKPCPFTNARKAKSGGSISGTVVHGFEERLARRIAQQLSASTRPSR